LLAALAALPASSGYSGLFHLYPLEASIFRVFDNEEQRKSRDSEGNQITLDADPKPLLLALGIFGQLLSIGLFGIGLWFIDIADRIQNELLTLKLSSFGAGLIVIILAWTVEHAALDLINFGHFHWEHLI
jgi:hypothetical protein